MSVPEDRLDPCVSRRSILSPHDIAAIETVPPLAQLSGETLHEVLLHSAGRFPDKAAIVQLASADDAAPLTISYRAYRDAIHAAAHLFAASTDGERPVVAVIAPYLPEALIAMWAGSIGGIAVPINPFLEIEHCAGIMNAAGANLLVIATDAAGPGAWTKLADLSGAVPSLKHVFRIGSEDGDDFATCLVAHRGRPFEPPHRAGADTVCAYLHTGGTTAAPKLVKHTNGGQLLQAWLCGTAMGSGEDDIVGHAMPNFHVGGAVAMSVRGVLFGQTLVTLTSAGFRDPDVVRNFWSIVGRTGMTSITTAPTTAAAILAADGDGPATLRYFTTGGGPLPAELARAFRARYGLQLKEVWGGTEFHGILSCHYGGDVPPRLGSCGVAVPYHEVRSAILEDGRYIRDAEPQERGVLIARGPTIIPGYVDPANDARFFITGGPDDARWATTGDIGTVDGDGYVWIYGREKDVIIRGGHNIDSALIDEVLSAHPAILFAAAVGKPCPLKGELPMAFVQLRPGAKADAGEVVAFCRDRISERAAVPVEIVTVDEIPLTAVGKVSKPPLRLEAIRRVAGDHASRIAPGAVSIAVAEVGGRPTVTLEGSADDCRRVAGALDAFTFAVTTAGAER